MAKYRLLSYIRYIEPNYKASRRSVPDDLSFGEQWGMHNSGQSGGTADADIDAPEAWSYADGKAASEVTVAVIDTGVDTDHPDLQANIHSFGHDYHNNDTNPSDDNGHGTHIAGTIAAVRNNGTGIAGLCASAKIMPLRFMDENGSGTLVNAIKALNDARAKGAKIINASWGIGAYESQALRETIELARSAGQLFVAAAGNSGVDNDTKPQYPASYDLDNIISVASTDHNDALSAHENWSSNYGAISVDLAAPGSESYSTLHEGSYGYLSGTSMAAAYVSGVAAYIWSLDPELSYAEVKQRILNSADRVPCLDGKTLTGGRLNAYDALNDGLIAYYPFNGNANDESGNGNHGAVDGATLTEDRHGDADSAYSFDGNDIILAPNPFPMTTTNTDPFSVSVWIKTSTEKSAAGIVTQSYACNGWYDDRFRFTLYNLEGMEELHAEGYCSGRAKMERDMVADGEWHNISLVYGGNNSTYLYMDGILQSSVNDPPNSPFKSSVDVGIGGFYNSICPDDHHFEGAIDDVRIYNRALFESEIRQLYGQSNPNSYTVTFESGPHGTLTGDTIQTVNHGEDCTPVEAVANSGYYFTGWSGGYSGTDNPLTITNVTADMTISANFEPVPPVSHTVTFGSDGNGSIKGSSPQTVNHGEDCTSVEAIPSASYHFTGWSGDYSGTDNPLTITNVTADMMITANFEPVTYTVSFEAASNGRIKSGNTSQQVGENQNCTPVEAEADDGYDFINWSGTGGFTSTDNPLTYGSVNSDMTITANFAWSFAIEPDDDSFDCSGGTGSISVTAPNACNWTANSNADWITITSPASGNGNGSVDYSVSENTSGDSRLGTINIEDQTLTLYQEACIAYDWKAVIYAEGQESGVTIGVAAEAKTEWAPPRPPVYTCALEISGQLLLSEDIRQSGEDEHSWVIAVNPRCSTGPPTATTTISWDPSEFASEGYYQLTEGDDPTGTVLVSDMRTTSEYDVTGGNADQYFTIRWRESVLFYMNMNAGWNLISLPMTPDNATLSALFPDAEVAYRYEDGGYADAAFLEPGKGYWVKVPADQTYTITGQPFPGYAASLSSGWHLLGSVNATSDPEVVPDGAVQVMYQYFDGAYRKVTQFSPGYGYWVGIKEDCEFTVDAD